MAVDHFLSQNKSNLSGQLVVPLLLLLLWVDGLGVSLIFPLLADLFLHPPTAIVASHTSEFIRNLLYGAGLMSFSLGMFLSAPWLGELSDIWGRKRALLLSLSGTGLSYLTTALGIALASPLLFIVGRFLGGLSAGNVPIAQAIVADFSPPHARASRLAWATFSVTAGYAVGPILSESLSKTVGHAVPFCIVAGISLPMLLAVSALQEPSEEWAERAFRLRSPLGPLRQGGNVGNGGLFAAFFLFQLSWVLYFQYLPHLLASSPLQQRVGVIMASVGAGMTVAFCCLVPLLQRAFTARVGLLVAVPMIVAGWGVQSMGSNYLATFAVAALLCGIGYALGYSFFLALIIERTAGDFRGLVLGIAASLSALSSVLAGLLGLGLVSWDPQRLLIVAILGMLAGYVGLWRQRLPPSAVG